MSDSILTGLVALGGVLVGYLVQFATSFGERRERHQRLNREKFELLCDLIHNSTVEVQELMGQTGESALRFNPASASKAHYLALIYFPELADATRTYSNKIALFRSSLYGSGFRPDIPVSMGAQAIMGNSDYKKQVHDLQLSRAAVEEKICEVAKLYTKA